MNNYSCGMSSDFHGNVERLTVKVEKALLRDAIPEVNDMPLIWLRCLDNSDDKPDQSPLFSLFCF